MNITRCVRIAATSVWLATLTACTSVGGPALATGKDPQNPWGLLASLADQQFNDPHERSTHDFRWVEPGRVLRFTSWLKDSPGFETLIRYDETAQQFSIDLADGSVVVNRDGSVSISGTVGQTAIKEVFSSPVRDAFRDVSWVNHQIVADRWMRRSFFNRTLAEHRTSLSDKSDNGWRGLLGGATAGLITAKVGGADGNATIAAMAKGAAIGSGDPETAGLLNQLASTAAAQPSGSSTSAAKPSGGKSGVAKFPKKFPVAGLAEACGSVGVTQQNYLKAALAPGNDVQLKTMCGEAYNYYSMYENAIVEGYSEKDCDRTYKAHAGAARVAIDFYKSSQ